MRPTARRKLRAMTQPASARIYLDANATTPLLPEVFGAMCPYLLESFGNASSTHQAGQHARAAVDYARDAVARLLGARAAEIIFTAGGTESDNLALFGTLAPGDHLITTTTEHHAVLHAAHALEQRGVALTLLGCDSRGLIDPDNLQQALRPETRLVSVLFANNETGVIQPIAQLAALAKAHGALFHTDAVQAAGKLPIDLAGELKDVDLLSLAGHKMYAPQGVGVLFLRRKTRLQPMLHGGAHERQRRAGTENVAGIVALGKAAELAGTWLQRDAPHTLAALRDRLEAALLQLRGSGVNGAGVPRSPNTSNLFFDGVDAESLLIALDLQGVAISAGSACQSGATEPSHVLTAMGLGRQRAHSSLRFSLSRLTTEEEVTRAVEIVSATVQRLRSLSVANSSNEL